MVCSGGMKLRAGQPLKARMDYGLCLMGLTADNRTLQTQCWTASTRVGSRKRRYDISQKKPSSTKMKRLPKKQLISCGSKWNLVGCSDWNRRMRAILYLQRRASSTTTRATIRKSRPTLHNSFYMTHGHCLDSTELSFLRIRSISSTSKSGHPTCIRMAFVPQSSPQMTSIPFKAGRSSCRWIQGLRLSLMLMVSLLHVSVCSITLPLECATTGTRY
mmetsp:Transcript_23479/g.37855  ORF Transcript_23479/g.37855 Transcript_23479/m.37855 type:complete len:217 (-) Transcript_23479:488-1138(-)